jgi:CheY-like chemotaxis protein
MDGHTMNLHLKENAATQRIPVIIVTARSGMAPMFDEKTISPIQGYLVKPFSAKELLSKIQQVFTQIAP